MAFNHRKLMLDSHNETVNRFCKPFCDSNKTQDGACPPICFPLCNHNCYRPLLSQIVPLPAPPPPNIPNDPPNKSPSLSLALTIPLSILVVAFTLFCCYTIYKCYKGWYRSRQVSQPRSEDDAHDDFLDEDHGPVVDHPIWYIRTVGLNPSVISAITICKYKKDEGLVEGTDCSVCLNEFQEDETLRLLPKCNHAFHIPCIDTWLTSHTNCPLCRAGIVRSTTASPSPELVVDDSGRAEETQVGTSENIEVEDEVEEEELGDENEIKKSEVGEFQPMRRSVSLDSSSAAMISAAIANVLHQGRSEANSDTQLVKVNQSNSGIVPKRIDVNQSLRRLMCSSSIARSLQRGPMFMKRSVSCSGKVLSSTTHGRNRNSILPP